MAVNLEKLRSDSIAAHQKGDLPKAARGYAAVLSAVPQDAAIWSNLGVLHRVAGRHVAARRAQERAYDLDPQGDGIANNLANILSDIGEYDRSIALRQKILQDTPDDAQHKALIGRCLRGKGDYAAAISYLEPAIAAHPDDAELKMQLAFAQLGVGDYAAGLNTYKARWQAGELEPRDLDFPEWQGEPLAGKTLVVLPEQGFGDAVLFARFLRGMKDSGARVLVVASRPLRRIFAGLEGADAVVPSLPKDADADYWVNMMDLAALHFEAGKPVPPPTSLQVPVAAQTRATAMTRAYEKSFKVGVVWTGSLTYKGNAFRSFSHRDFLPFVDIPGVQLFSLYKGPALDSYYADGTDAFILDAGSSESDFADCAAMMQAMDLVITSDTATAHIAGSLGVPVWTILHWDAFWVYRHHGDTTEWYPGMRLFRQQTPLDWSAVMAEVGTALRGKVKGE